MGKITLSNIAEELAVKSNLTREAADNFMRAFVATIEKGLQEDGVVKVKGLGTFKLQEVSDRDSVDVNTGERITIKGYRKVTFVPDSAMKELVNRPFAHFEPTELNDGYPAEEEMSSSDSVIGENEEMVEEVVEVVVEDTATEDVVVEETSRPVVEEPQEKVVETVEFTESVEVVPIVEAEMDERIVAEDVIEEAKEEITEQPLPVQEETCEQEDVFAQENFKQESKKQRGCGCWIVLLVLFAFAAILAFILGWFAPSDIDKSHDEVASEEYSDIMVNPNLVEELRTEWGDEQKAEETQLAVKKLDTAVVFEPKLVVADTHQSQPIETVNSTESAKSAEPTTDTFSKPVASVSSCAVTLTESLQAKSVKDVTLADTTEYIIAGTFTIHKLKSGETIIQLSNKYYGDKRLWPYIVKYNKMKNFNNVAIGQKIDIPMLRMK